MNQRSQIPRRRSRTTGCRRCDDTGYRPTGNTVEGPGGEIGDEVVPCECRSTRVDIAKIMEDPIQRRELMVMNIIATAARAGIVTSREDAQRAYDVVQIDTVQGKKNARNR